MGSKFSLLIVAAVILLAKLTALGLWYGDRDSGGVFPSALGTQGEAAFAESGGMWLDPAAFAVGRDSIGGGGFVGEQSESSDAPEAEESRAVPEEIDPIATVALSSRPKRDPIGEVVASELVSGASATVRLVWYDRIIHDAFASYWVQPSGIVAPGEELRTAIKVTIAKDGSILDYHLDGSSGNAIMDRSVLEAAKQVDQIPPLPSAITEDRYPVVVTFVLG